MYPQHQPANSSVHAGSGGGGVSSAATADVTPMDPAIQQQQNLNYNGMQQQHQQQAHQQQTATGGGGGSSSKSGRKKPFVKITEQPAGKALRFRYECEGRSAGSIPGVNSTSENKTYPTIEVVGYKGRAVVVVSCVTKDAPYRPHPHNLVGKEGCKRGVCTLEINSETMRAVFSNLGIQCVKKKDIEPALKVREEIRVDPFKTGFSHRFQPSNIDLNSVRLCFQVFMEGEQKGRFTQPLAPVVSDPIYDKKAMSDLVICRLCSCSASVLGNTTIILLCEKVAKEDIAVRFFEEKSDWEAYGEFQHTDVHKQTAITFKTPRYHSLDITEPAKVFIQLRRPSDGVTSEALPFEYVPHDSGTYTFWNLRRNLKRKPDLDLFQEILAIGNDNDGEVQGEVIDLDTPTAEEKPLGGVVDTIDVDVDVVDKVFSAIDQSPAIVEAEEDAAKRRSEHEIDTIIDEKVRQLELELEQQQQEQQQEPEPQYIEQPAMTAKEKIAEWMQAQKSSESTQSGETVRSPVGLSQREDEDRTLNELLDQVAELDEIYTDHMLLRDSYDRAMLNELSSMDIGIEPENPAVAMEVVDDIRAGTRAPQFNRMEVEESFDDAATYTSLQIAFKHPVDIPMDDIMPPTPPTSYLAPEDAQHYDHVEVMQSPPRPPTKSEAAAAAASPRMYVTAAEEEKRPPLPPKRLKKQDSNAENRSIEANTIEANPSVYPEQYMASTTTTANATLERNKQQRNNTPIIIMKTPDQSPLHKRLPAKPVDSLSKNKKSGSGFFSKLFSRRKSKPELGSGNGDAYYPTSPTKGGSSSKCTSPDESREPSIGHFQMNDASRYSMRSTKSLQPGISSLPTSPERRAVMAATSGKPVGRSVSSVSGKRPSHLSADVIHIPLKGESVNSLPMHHEAYSNASTLTLGPLDRRTASALQLAEIPISEGGMELVAIADRQSLKNLCEGEFNFQLGPNVDLTEAEHFALYTSIPPQATASEFDEQSAYYAAVDAGEILSPEEIARRLAEANPLN